MLSMCDFELLNKKKLTRLQLQHLLMHFSG